MELCTNLQNRVIDLEKTKTSQAQEIISLKRRVKRLEKKNRSKTHGLKRLYKVGLSARIESSKDEGLGEEDASKQGRIDDIDANKDIYLVNVHRDEDMFGVNDLEGYEVIVETKVDHEVVVETEVASKDVNLKLEQGTITTTTNATIVTAASTRPKAKGLVIHEEEQVTTPKVSSQQPSQVKVQDKGNGIMVEEPLKMKKKDQISFDEQEAIRLQAEFDEEERLARADGSSKMYLVFSHMLKSFDREDLETLYNLVKAKYRSTRPVEDLDLVLYGDLKTMFEPHVEDNVWKNQSDYRVLDWKLYDSCGVHLLRKQNVHIRMLVEKRYPLTVPTITDMLNRKLQADH
ncbi:hypothetical protein Tco_1485187 [Tanacetum coccineum]